MGRRRTIAHHSRILLTSVLLLCSCSHPTVRDASKTARITQFYARDPAVPRGEKTVLCYGVENAKTVRIQPPVDKVWPAISRCFDIAPSTATTYTLTAEGEDKQKVTQSVTVQIGPAPPKIIEVVVNSLSVHAGELVRVCYKVKNAKSVKVEPGTPEHGCVVDKPKKTTTYTVTASNAEGITDTERVTVSVK
ncbi:MAG TPA: hypothetical protein VIX89_07660 [Bryobacteraceae bacterium]